MEQQRVLTEEYIPIKSRVWVASADAACAVLGSLAASGVLTYYFTRWRGLDSSLAAIVWLLFGIWNAVNDPLYGYISDRTKSKLGRRIPYIRYGAPFYAVSFIACWMDWPGTVVNQTTMFLQMLFLLLIFDTLYTAIATAIFIMPYEMAVSNKARSGIFIWKIIFMIFPTAIPLVLIPIIQPGPGEDATTYRLIMTILGVSMGLIIFLSTFFYKEKHFHQNEQQLPFFKSIKECFTNIPFLIFEVLSFTIIYVQTGLMQGVLYYFDELKVPGVPVYVTLFTGIVFGVILWVKKNDFWGVKNCMRIMCLLFSLGCFIVIVLGKQLVPAIAGFFLFGIGFSGAMYLIPIMMGDTIDFDEHRTKLRREGMYAGVNSFITKPSMSIAQAVFLSVISWFGYDQTVAKGMQSASAQTGILIGWLLVPGILLLISFVALRWYPLHGDSWKQTKLELTQLHNEKEKEYLEKSGFTNVGK